MKKFILVSSLLLMSMFAYGCGSETETDEAETTEVTDTTEVETEKIASENEAFTVEEIRDLGEDCVVSDNDGYYMFYSKESNANGIMDSDGNVVIEPEYFYIEYTDGLYFVMEDGTYMYFLNPDGTVAFDTVDGYKIGFSSGFDDGLAIVRLMDEANPDFAKEVVVDKKGNIVIQNDEPEGMYTKIDDTYVFANNYSTVSLSNYNEITHVYSEEGTELSLSDFENYDGDDIFEFEDIYLQQDPNTLCYAIYDIESGKAISEFNLTSGNFGSIGDREKIGDNYIVTKIIGDSFSRVLIDSKGNTVFDIDATYPEAGTYFECNDKLLINLTDGNKSVLLDENGTLVKELNFICNTVDDYGIYHGDDGGYGIVDSDFNTVTDTRFDSLGNIVDGSCLAVVDGVLNKLTIN